LDAIIAVGYRVNSKKATKFRQWATATLKEYITKGFVLNDEMLKNGKPFGKDYFDELLERIREIRASERRAYQKIADVFEQCSYDYDKNSVTTKSFYAFVQNKYSDFRYIPILSHCKPGTQDILIIPGITLPINRNIILRSNRAAA